MLIPKKEVAKPDAKTRTRNAILDRLSNPALPDTRKEVKAAKKYRSSFFFRLDGDEHEKARRKSLTEKPKIPRSERELDERAESYKKELPANMDKKIDEVREFLLTTINPLVLAALAGSEQAFNVLGKATNSEVENAMHNKLQQMLQKGVQIKLSRFVTEYLGLKAKDAEVLLEKTPPATVIFPSLSDVKPEHPIGGRRGKQGNK